MSAGKILKIFRQLHTFNAFFKTNDCPFLFLEYHHAFSPEQEIPGNHVPAPNIFSAQARERATARGFGCDTFGQSKCEGSEQA